MGSLFIQLDAADAHDMVAENPGFEIVPGIDLHGAIWEDRFLEYERKTTGHVDLLTFDMKSPRPAGPEVSASPALQPILDRMGVSASDLVGWPPSGSAPQDYVKVGPGLWAPTKGVR